MVAIWPGLVEVEVAGTGYEVAGTGVEATRTAVAAHKAFLEPVEEVVVKDSGYVRMSLLHSPHHSTEDSGRHAWVSVSRAVLLWRGQKGGSRLRWCCH